jgi:hypothetical protein
VIQVTNIAYKRQIVFDVLRVGEDHDMNDGYAMHANSPMKLLQRQRPTLIMSCRATVVVTTSAKPGRLSVCMADLTPTKNPSHGGCTQKTTW